MRRIAQKFGTCRHRLQNSALPFDTQVDHDVRFVSHVAHQRLGLMDVKIVGDKMPTDDRQIGLDRTPNVIDKVFLGSCVAIGIPFDAASGYVEVDHEALGAVAHILELLPFNLTRRHAQGRVFALQGLYAAQLIDADHLLTLFRQFWRLPIQCVDVLYFLIKLLIEYRRQPVSDQMRFEIALFLKASPRVGARWYPGYLVS